MSSFWSRLKLHTQARIGLNRHGASLSTQDLLEFQLAHAEARDAVWRRWEPATTATALANVITEPIFVSSQAHDRAEFLKRPDLGRRLSDQSRKDLERYVTNSRSPATPHTDDHFAFDVAPIVSDGLSAKAIDTHFLPLWSEVQRALGSLHVSLSPLVLSPFSRVAISDEIGQTLRARIAVIFIGERPGLSSTDSVGIYLTYDPKPGNTDAGRNCISNVRPPEGLSYATAAAKLRYLISESLRRKLSGVDLKEDAPRELAEPSNSVGALSKARET